MGKGIVDKLIAFVNPAENGQDECVDAQNGEEKQNNLVISEPRSFDEVQQIAGFIKMSRPVILNTSKLDKETSRRILDFMSGCIYSLEGDIQKISEGIFLLTSHMNV